MSGYVPPHLRGAASGGDTPPPRGGGGYGDGGGDRGGSYSAGPRTGGYGGDRGGYGDGGRDGGRDYGGSFGGARRGQGDAVSSSPAAGRDETPRGRGPPDAVFLEWKPAAHVSSLTKEQVEDIRKRLDVIVEVEDGQPIAASPIECFEDMVRPHAACAAFAAARGAHAPGSALLSAAERAAAHQP